MKNKLKIIALLLALVMAFALCACGDKSSDQTPSGDGGNNSNISGDNNPGDQTPQHEHSFVNGIITTDPTFNANGVKTYTCSCGQTRTESVASLIPTKAQFATGVQTRKEKETQYYDFNISLTGNVTAMGYTVNADGAYDGKYRYSAQNGSLKFYRKTSGKILYDGQEYIYNKGDSRIKVKSNKNGEVTGISVSPKSDDEMNMLNLPFIAIVNALQESNVMSIQKSSDPKYRFETRLHFSSDFSPINKLLTLVGAFGANISFKGLTFTNPQNGVKMLFNVSDSGELLDFTFDLDIGYTGENGGAVINIQYTQANATADLVIPDFGDFKDDQVTISAYLGEITTAINAVKNSNSYSIDMTAGNELDPGWNKLAVNDQFISRMYKNLNDGRVDFNNSFKYKAHTEEDGKESFTYTIGNIQDGSVYEISRKGTNTQTLLNDVTVDTRFDVHAALMAFATSDVQFMLKKANGDGTITYTLFTTEGATYTQQQKIAELINSNKAEDAIKIENYFNSDDYDIIASEFVFVVKNGALVSYNANVELHYVPVVGEYSGVKVDLKDTVSLTVNENLDKAKEYVAPKNVETKLLNLGLNNAKYYIQ